MSTRYWLIRFACVLGWHGGHRGVVGIHEGVRCMWCFRVLPTVREDE